MIVYYRMCDVKSGLSNPSPVHADNNYKLHEVCLRSFVEAFKDIGPRMVFIADYCGQEYEDMVSDIVPFPYEYKNTAFGINQTCLMQYQMFEKQDDDMVLFQEYDYLWRPVGTEFIKALETLPFITPYDHPDKYDKETEPYVTVVGNHHWKKTESTTATFATTRSHFNKHADTLYKHGYIDHQRWIDIGEEGGDLFSPLPAMATHMVKDYMSHHVDWMSILQTSQ